MQAAFGTSLQNYDSPGGTFRGRTGYLTIPSTLSGIVSAVLGLDNRPVAKAHLRKRRAAQPAGLSPRAVAQAYNFPDGAQGAGQTIGILELGGGYSTSDLNKYFSGLGLKTPTVSSVSVDGGANQPGVDTDSDGEVMLDIEVAGAVAPEARIVVYFAPNTDQGFVDAITTAAQDTANRPSVLSISWGGPEDSWTSQSATAMLNACTDAAAVGMTVTAAAGDDGATDGETGLHVDLPACLPPVLGCGGTKLTLAGTGISNEVVWNELASNEGATGGGVSQIYALPSYQSSAGVPLQPGSTFVGRGVPDVASDADPNTGYDVLVDGQTQVIGGTSAAAPLWAGLIALLNQQLGKPVGFVQPALYQIGESAFRDIVSGNNDGYSAGPGWDACTGLGSPNGGALLKALQGLSSAARPRRR
jgi:kumamolisin